MEKYAVFLDIDGTLASFGIFPYSSPASPENIEAINRVRSLGHYVFLNTGRSYEWISKEILTSVKVDGIISGAGSQITLNGGIFYENMLAHSAVTDILNAYSDSGKLIMLGGTDRIFVMNPSANLSNAEYITIESPDFIEKNYPGAKIQKFEVFSSEITPSQKHICEQHLNMFYHPEYYEGCPLGVSKSKAMAYACKKLGIPEKNSIAMGDSSNDIDMLTAAGIGVAMGDASENVKNAADFISLSCGEHGVAYALEKLILNK